MSLVLNTNIASLNAQNNLTGSQASLSQALQRLSSGLRINSAADDAAGLASSQQFTTQINGTNQAVSNAHDAVSEAQTTAGALNTIVDNLQSIRTLAVESANGSNSASDRAALNNQVQQQIAEITQIAQQTTFNGLNVLNGSSGYPPSVFARLPQLVERAGNSDRGVGSITAFYTVLVEGDDQNDPISDAARAILDGHIVLSRRLAENGLYPAVDVEASISRAMHQIATREQLDLSNRFRQVYSTYQQNRDLITVGAYRRGSDARVDLAVEQWPKMLEFLRRDMYEPVGIERSYADLKQLVTQFSAPAAPRGRQ
jgi:hypothetical protein